MTITTLVRWKGGDPAKVKALATECKALPMHFGARDVTLSRIFTGPQVGRFQLPTRFRS